jgi:hypothetical protein
MPKISFNIDSEDILECINQFDYPQIINIIEKIDTNVADADFSIETIRRICDNFKGETVTKLQKKELRTKFDELLKSLKIEN